MRRLFGIRSWGLLFAMVAIAIFAANCRKHHGSKKGGGGQQNPPEITAIAPNVGGVPGGDVVTIITVNFQDDFMVDTPVVSFGGTPATTTVAVAPNTVQATTPPHAVPEAVDVQVDSTGIVETAVEVGGFTYSASPPCNIASIQPTAGYMQLANVVVIFGTNFDTAPAPTVEFGSGNQATNVIPMSSTQIQATAPTSATPGLVDVIVTNQNNTCTLPNAFEYLPPPLCSVTDVNPVRGRSSGGEIVLITGMNFEASPLPTVEFGSGNPVFPTDVSVIDTTRISVVTPPGTAGFVDVIVTTSTGPCALPGAYEYYDPITCTVSTITPAFGPEFGGNAVTIAGVGFTPASRVWFGAVEATPVTVVSPSQIDTTAPPGTGMVDITIDIGGSITCNLTAAFNYVACGGGCQLQNVSPGSGGTGDLVTINGNGFLNGALVYFMNGADVEEATVQAYNIPSSIDVLVPNPPGGARTVDVQVVNPDGTCCSRNNAFDYTGCIISGLSRSSGPDTGGQPMSIYGSGFTANPLPEVWFGTAQGTTISATQTEIMVVTPPSGGQMVVDVTIVNSGGGSCTCAGCYVYGGCVINTVTPNSGGTNGGAVVSITGWGFDPFSLKVNFGNNLVNPTQVQVDPSGTLLTVIAPPSAIGGPVDVSVFNETLITQCTVIGGYTYNMPGGQPCTITAITPSSGCSSGGQTITISGTGFDAGTGVLFGQLGAPRVIFDPISTNLTVVTAPYYGPIPPQPRDVTVAPANRPPATRTNGFNYTDPACPGGCSIASATPNSGPAAGGNTITINGSGFCNCSPIVNIGNQMGQTMWIDANTLEVIVPPSLTGPGTVDIVYVDPGQCFSVCAGCYTYN